jgi:signal transduction histidine kinase
MALAARAYNAGVVRRLSEDIALVPRITGASAIVAGLLVQAGWLFDIRALRQPMPDASAMMPTTATTMIVCGVALWLLSTNRLPRLAMLLGALVGVIGVLSLGHVMFGPDFFLDQLWMIDRTPPARMSPFTASCYALLGPALMVSARQRQIWAAHVLALLAALIAVIVSIGYLYKVSNLVGVGLYTTMAPHTAVLMLAVCIGVLCLKPAEGVMAVLTADTLGGQMARRTLPASIGIPIALGWLRLAGEQAGLYNPKVGPPLVVVGSIVFVSTVIWLNAKLLGQVDAKRRAAEDDLRQANEVLEARVAEKTASIRAAEERLRAGQRMEAMGQLAGGVAHDFNNMMTVVSGYSELLLGQIQADDPSRRALVEIKKAGDRCARMTGHLLAFSRRQMLAPSLLDLNAIVDDLCNMLPMLLGENITVVTRTSPDLWPVRADPAQIEQVIVNLVVNARDAMPSGGSLAIETSNVEADRGTEPRHPEMAPGPYVLLRITDTGHGMDPDTQARAFDPFFTTKPVGEGTGLGLSTAYGVIKQSSGHIFVDSTPGAGTSFRIYLPRVESATTSRPAVVETSRAASGDVP